ncbi:spore germination protein [Paenactinomyces guangxiensis]|uniref:Spore germination protein n=1 Tax=Paenactinomyces guangxiensis TaxID=1490290 RepID=A0A7W1WRQ8_9BACL|nr:spore germination protein [Paenactinomyces guangxiensis]MBA4494767.1 spore germination protein [Paenactinomyces guangxiensis]MBH8591851.1 spore germination protein [Paenactinomyces guangxiensis]
MRNRSFRFKRSRKRKKEKFLAEYYEQKLEETVEESKVYNNLEQNLEFIKNVFGDTVDLVQRKFVIPYTPEREAVVLYLDELVNKNLINEFILSPLMTQADHIDVKADLWKDVEEHLVQVGETEKTDEMKKVVDAILNGDSVLIINGYDQAMILGTKGWDKRSIDEPRAEAVVRGPREGLSETLSVSLGLIRRRLKDPHLRIKNYKIGERTQTAVNLIYIKDVADPDVVKEVEKRLKDIKIDGILESGYVEEFIQDITWTPFPQIQNTERPDAVVGHLLEGKVAILVDGTPHVLIAPAVFTQFYYSPEDYYERFHISSFLRLIRLLSLFVALLLPALYIAFVSFHPEMIPSELAIAMAGGRASVPFPSILEALVMEISVEILREASIRLPGPIGPTIGIVGGLVIGNAAVDAGLVSPAIVIVVGLTTISSYANPSYNAAISVRLIRFPLMIAAAIFGLYGIMLGLMLVLVHLVQLQSFGIPYMTPYAPFNWRDLKDSLIRTPWTWMNKRPTLYRPQDRQREQEGGNA